MPEGCWKSREAYRAQSEKVVPQRYRNRRGRRNPLDGAACGTYSAGTTRWRGRLAAIGCAVPGRSPCGFGFARNGPGFGLGGVAAKLLGIGAGELGAEQESQRRIVDPQQNDDQRTGRPISLGDIAAADIEADQRFADREQEC